MAKACKNCGNELNDNVKFCPKCGTRCAVPVEMKKESQEATLETNTVANEIHVENSQVEMKTEPDNVSGKKSAKWKKWGIGLLAVLIVFGIVKLFGGNGYTLEKSKDSACDYRFSINRSEFHENLEKIAEDNGVDWEYSVEDWEVMGPVPDPVEAVPNSMGGEFELARYGLRMPTIILRVDEEVESGKISNVNFGPISYDSLGKAYVWAWAAMCLSASAGMDLEKANDYMEQLWSAVLEGKSGGYGENLLLSVIDEEDHLTFYFQSCSESVYENKLRDLPQFFKFS